MRVPISPTGPLSADELCSVAGGAEKSSHEADAAAGLLRFVYVRVESVSLLTDGAAGDSDSCSCSKPPRGNIIEAATRSLVCRRPLIGLIGEAGAEIAADEDEAVAIDTLWRAVTAMAGDSPSSRCARELAFIAFEFETVPSVQASPAVAVCRLSVVGTRSCRALGEEPSVGTACVWSSG